MEISFQVFYVIQVAVVYTSTALWESTLVVSKQSYAYEIGAQPWHFRLPFAAHLHIFTWFYAVTLHLHLATFVASTNATEYNATVNSLGSGDGCRMQMM